MKSQEEIEHLKSNINLVDYAEDYGFSIVKKKSSRNSIVMEKNGEKILISKENGRYLFFNIDTEKGGSIIDFHQEYVRKEQQFFKIIIALRNYRKNHQIIRNPIQEIEIERIREERKAIIALSRLNELKNIAYFQERKINQETIKEFKQYIKQDSRGNICFPTYHFYFDDENKFRFEQTGIEKKNKEFKQQMGEKGLWGKKVGSNKKEEDIYIFESPIDAMSFYQLYQNSGFYISIGGNISEKQKESLKVLNKQIEPRNVFLCLDNDIAGEKIAGHIIPCFPQLNPERLKPKFKDFNEDLQKNNKKIKNKNYEIGR